MLAILNHSGKKDAYSKEDPIPSRNFMQILKIRHFLFPERGIKMQKDRDRLYLKGKNLSKSHGKYLDARNLPGFALQQLVNLS